MLFKYTAVGPLYDPIQQRIQYSRADHKKKVENIPVDFLNPDRKYELQKCNKSTYLVFPSFLQHGLCE